MNLYCIGFVLVLFQMGRSKLKKKLKLKEQGEESIDTESTAIPIKNLPEKFICMQVSLWGLQIHAILFDFTQMKSGCR